MSFSEFVSDATRLTAKVTVVYCIGAGVVLGGIGAVNLGPIDFPRTVYNRAIGDDQILKERLAEHVTARVRIEKRSLGDDIAVSRFQAPEYADHRLEELLGKGTVDYTNHEIILAKVPIGKLWDAQEKYSAGPVERFFGPNLDE